MSYLNPNFTPIAHQDDLNAIFAQMNFKPQHPAITLQSKIRVVFQRQNSSTHFKHVICLENSLTNLKNHKSTIQEIFSSFADTSKYQHVHFSIKNTFYLE